MTDTYVDDVNQFQYTEVALDYNAGFVGAMAAITTYYGGIQIQTSTPKATPTPKVTPTSASGYKISGYIAPDVSNGEVKGFSVKVKNSQQYHSQTDDKGYFEILGLPDGTNNYTLEITKAGYLTREVSVLTQGSDTSVSAPGSPILMWAGDIPVNDVQDGAINMKDVIEIGKCFNAIETDSKYKKFCDLNVDVSINMSDIVIIARHFGKTTADYN